MHELYIAIRSRFGGGGGGGGSDAAVRAVVVEPETEVVVGRAAGAGEGGDGASDGGGVAATATDGGGGAGAEATAPGETPGETFWSWGGEGAEVPHAAANIPAMSTSSHRRMTRASLARASTDIPRTGTLERRTAFEVTRSGDDAGTSQVVSRWSGGPSGAL